MNSKNLISFTEDFVSYLIQSIGTKDFERIILFGSVARKEADKKSDVDIFIESKKNIQDKINEIIDRFYNSSKYTKYWKALGIRNQIKCIVGSLNDFPDLKRSIVNNAIVLYAPYKGEVKGTSYALFIVSFRGAFKDKMRAWRKLYGSSQKRGKKLYRTKGFLEDIGGKRISKGVFIIPIHKTKEAVSFLKKICVKYKVIEINSDTL